MRSMHQYTKISDADIENLTNLAGVKIFDLSQNEGLALVRWQTIDASANQRADLLREHTPLQVGRWTSPVTFGVEARVEHFIDRVHAVVNDRSATALQRLSMQNAEQPSSELRPPFEAVQPLEKSLEYILYQVLCFLLHEPQPFCRSHQWPRVITHSFGECVRIAAPEAFQKIRADWDGRCHKHESL